jgi:putative DNA methylase
VKLEDDSGAVRNAGSLAGTSAQADVKGWYSRGHLPHFDEPGLYQALTFRLYDSVPAQVVEQWKEGLHGQPDQTRTLSRRILEYEDAGHGACWMRNERIASTVENNLLRYDDERYRLIAWCIMPNHVHVLIETVPGYPLGDVLHSWKSYTAQMANRILGLSGAFWAREYYDRYIRDERHFAQMIAYIEENPVKAGFVQVAKDWTLRTRQETTSRSAGSACGIGWPLACGLIV